MKVATFYHVGCPVSMEAKNGVLKALDLRQYVVETVNLKKDQHRIWEAKDLGVKSLPALVINGHSFHINFSMSLDSLLGQRQTRVEATEA